MTSSGGASPTSAPPARSTPTRSSPTTSPTPRPPSRRPGRCSTTAPRATTRPPSPAPSSPTPSPTLAGKLFGREAAVGRRARRARRRPRVRRRPTATRRSWRRIDGRRPPAPRRRLRDGAGHVPPLRRGQDHARSPSTSTATTTTSPRRSSPASPRWAPSGCRSPRSTAASPTGGESDYIGMVVATEELSRGSLGAGGSLITRPEILTRALVKGGTEEQKQEWLPKLATAEVMDAVAVTEPDYGSDVAGIKVTATTRPSGGWLINGVKTWCTFGARADVLMLLARTDPDRSEATAACRCSSCPSRVARATASSSRRRPEPTAGRRAAARWRAARSTPSATGACTPTRSPSTTGSWPTENLIGGEDGLGKGFYYQMAGFENGRLQTAARAIGVMQAAYEAARQYAAGPRGVRPAHRRLPADPGQARPHGRHHPGGPPVRLRGGPPDGQGRGLDRGVDGQGLRLQGRRVGHPRGHADPRRLWATPRSTP